MPQLQDFPAVAPSAAPSLKQQGQKGRKKSKGVGFQTLGLGRDVFGGVLKMGYKVPTPIQRKALPVALSGKDVVAMARTGSGKTAAFLIPMLERLGEHSSLYGARGVVLSPTRELAQQIYTFALGLGKLTSLRICLLQGGDRMEAQFEALSNNPDIIVATPGRLVHMLGEVRDLSLGRVEILVFDEADRLFEMGFAGQLEEIIEKVPMERQTLLFSATMPKQLMEFAKAGLQNPELIRLDTETKISDNLKLAFFSVRSIEKVAGLMHLLTEVIPSTDQTIIFTATRHHVEYLSVILEQTGLKFSVAYGSMDMESRKINVEKFRRGQTKLLLVTDIAARGIDIPLLNNVINFDYPAKPKLFVHRVGRAARQGRSGTAFTFLTKEEVPYLMDLHLFLGRKLNVVHNRTYSLKEMTPDDVDFGRMPQITLDNEVERLNKLHSLVPELPGLIKSMKNAHTLYLKTRGDASRRSVIRSKTVELPGIHPLFQQSTDLPSVESTLSALRGFRPRQTVFEVEASKKGSKQSDTSEALAAMKTKRRAHQKFIENKVEVLEQEKDDSTDKTKEQGTTPSSNQLHSATNVAAVGRQPKRLSKAQRKRLKKQPKREQAGQNKTVQDTSTPNKAINVSKLDSGGTKTFRDSQFYIANAPADFDQQRETEAHLSVNGRGGADGNGKQTLSSALLDLTPDSKKDISSQQRTYHWDKRKKKYIKATAEEHIKSNRIRNEAGAKITIKNRGEFYEKWQKKSKKRIVAQGTEESEAAEKSVSVKLIARKLRKQKYDAAGNSDELKDENKIRSELKEKQKRLDKNARGKKRKKEAAENQSNTRKVRTKGSAGFDRNSRSRVIIKSKQGKKKSGKGGNRYKKS